mmetsp:Transcript_9855/g.31643  ORF Transcript_9855/g.31643 Transcript_9855/m.31643 type:complete len:127 (+) Transcript_9855:1477-1857(+)
MISSVSRSAGSPSTLCIAVSFVLISCSSDTTDDGAHDACSDSTVVAAYATAAAAAPPATATASRDVLDCCCDELDDCRAARASDCRSIECRSRGVAIFLNVIAFGCYSLLGDARRRTRLERDRRVE